MEIKIYTDGACVGNPGPGGWAAIILIKNEKKELFGGEKLTTNNRMELTAAIKTLEYFLETMKSDSPNGKKLGFIGQEIGREINTIGSKSSDAEMQKIVVQMKDELEKIKEQLLNIL